MIIKIASDSRSNNTQYAGILGVKRAWNHLNCNSLLLQSGIRKRSGIPANDLAFIYAAMPLIDAESISKTSELVNKDHLLNALGSQFNQCTLNRFINADWDWIKFNEFRVTALQRNSLTKAANNGLLIIDDTIIRKFGKQMEGVEWVYDHVLGKSVLGYDLLVLHYTDDVKSYPVSFAFKLKTNNRIQLAIELATRAVQLGIGTKHVTFDAFYFATELINALDELGLYWVTKSKGNRKFSVNGEIVNARQVIEQDVDEIMAWLPDYGDVKLVKARINRKWHLLVTNDLGMPREQVIEIYRKRFSIDNPFFRDSKQEVGLTSFHLRKFRGIIGHVTMTFLTWTLLSLLKLLNKRLFSKTIGWIKEKFVKVVAWVRRTGQWVAVVLDKAHRWMITILKPRPE